MEVINNGTSDRLHDTGVYLFRGQKPKLAFESFFGGRHVVYKDPQALYLPLGDDHRHIVRLTGV